MENWYIRNKKGDVDKIAESFNISKVTSKILINRDITQPERIDQFLNPSLDKLPSSKLMDDMDIASGIIVNKIKDRRRIRIVGDFDVDGIMSVYILYTALKNLGAMVDYVIPDRVNDGYGINDIIILEAKAHGIDTIITVDNGIGALEQVKLAKKMGITVIITDHHDITIPEDGNVFSVLPEADAILNPKKPFCKYPQKTLCGAGVVFKLITNLYDLFGLKGKGNELLEFVSIATICDVVDLVDENRVIVVEGLKRLNNTENVGLRALLRESSLEDKELGVYHVGFIIGPSFNATGRLDSALIGLDLLLEKDEIKAQEKAKTIRALNDERKLMTEKGIEKIANQVQNKYLDSKIIVAYEPNIHESIAGIIAGRIKEKYNKPTIVLTNGKEGVKGSARSIEGYHIYEELSKARKYLNRFGGHPMAAGLSLDEINIEVLRNFLNNNSTLTNEDLVPKVYIDIPLNISSIDMGLVQELKILEPHGKGNPKPLFGQRDLSIRKINVIGSKMNVLKFQFLNTPDMEGIMFSGVDECIADIVNTHGEEEYNRALLGKDNNIKIDIVYSPSINEYMGRISVQLVINNYRIQKNKERR